MIPDANAVAPDGLLLGSQMEFQSQQSQDASAADSTAHGITSGDPGQDNNTATAKSDPDNPKIMRIESPAALSQLENESSACSDRFLWMMTFHVRA